jgi:isoamylase
MLNTQTGTSYPLGSTITEDGTNFAIFSENATSVDLEIYRKSDDSSPSEVISLKNVDNHVWHTHISGIGAGTLYGYRVDGPFMPEKGHRFNRNKLLIDPYAKALSGTIKWSDDIFGYVLGDQNGDLSFNKNDDAGFVPKSIVYGDNFDWKGVKSPKHPWNRTVIYETHVKGFTKRLDSIPESIRGTFSGLSSHTAIQHLLDLGITAVELMPVHQKVDSDYLQKQGLSNYWGYNTIGYFAPDIRYSSNQNPAEQINEFKNLVKNMHENNIEVILDVVYNHTGEGNQLGPTLSFRGIDNAAYYRLNPENQRFYDDFTGTGNSLDAGHPQVLQLIMDSLRYWVTEMHIDGFRFDLAATLARQLFHVDRLSAFFDIIHQDPILSRVKLIAEPWDIGPGGYQVGRFPVLWAEWNGKYRDCSRHYWKDRGSNVGEFATRLSGSPDLYAGNGRRPHASINYITAHDGFTMYDLVSYSSKHNDANHEGGKDGTDDNISENFGVEGPTADSRINASRNRRMRNFFLTLLTSQGVPMILGGDEIMRSQLGNNNAYCQDNETSWYDWNLDEEKQKMREFVRKCISIRMRYSMLRRREFQRGATIKDTNTKDITWLNADGSEIRQEQWNGDSLRALGVLLTHTEKDVPDAPASKAHSEDIMIIYNPTDSVIEFSLPARWKSQEIIIDSIPDHHGTFPISVGSKKISVDASSICMLREIN